MPILVTCECGKQFQAKDENVGRRFACTQCGRELLVSKGAEMDPYAAPLGYEGYQTKTSGKAITALVLGLLSFICSFFTGLPAIIFGALSLSDIGYSRGRLGGKGMAISGIVLGCLGSSLMGIALLLPAVQAAREAARRAQCVNNFKRMGLAFHNFVSSEGHFPAAAITDEDGKPLLSWRVAILPYIEEESLYRQFKLDEPWDSPTNKALIAQMPKVYLCPSNPVGAPGMTHYQVIVGKGTIFEDNKPVTLQQITDGTANTIMAVEGVNEVPWTKPDDIDIRTVATAFKSRHPGGVNVLFADGSVRFIKYTISPSTLKGLSTRNGGEIISPVAY